MGIRLAVIFMVFFVMGFGDVRGSFVGIARETYGITAAQGSLVPFAGAVAFGLFALPAGLLATRKGKRYVLQAGLLLTAFGHALPWLLLRNFQDLLVGVFLIGAGMTFLLVAGNPVMQDVAGPARFARNLTFAQFIKALGAIAGPYLIAAIVALGWTWKGIFPVFAGIALATWGVLALVPIPEATRLQPAHLRDLRELLRSRAVRWNMAGIFLFVGSEMGMNTFLASHMWLTHGLGIEGDAIRLGQGLFWLAEGVGRLLGALVLNWMDTRRFFLGCALTGLGALGGLMLGNGPVAIVSVALCGMTFANIWPCLFALTLALSPDRSSELGGLTVLANVGGAVLPFLMGLVADHGAVRWAFIVPAAAFIYLVVLARIGRTTACAAAGTTCGSG